MARIFNPETLESEHVLLTPEGEQAWNEYQRDYLQRLCQHAKTEIRIRTTRGGRRVVWRQCIECGHYPGNALPAEQGHGAPDGDEELEQRYEQARREERETIIEMHRFDYRAYLQTPEWRARARLVMERAGGFCEGCRKRRADAVHHTTYRNIGNEFLFELLALCHACHARWHGHDE